MNLLSLLPDWAVTNVLYKAKLKPGLGKESFDEDWDDERAPSSIEDATLISSEIFRTSEKREDTWHQVLLDLDMSAKIVPSSTPGHGHLYINKVLRHDQYYYLLTALRNAGIIESGIVKQFEKHGCTTLRLPHVKKEPLPHEPEVDNSKKEPF